MLEGLNRADIVRTMDVMEANLVCLIADTDLDFSLRCIMYQSKRSPIMDAIRHLPMLLMLQSKPRGNCELRALPIQSQHPGKPL
jgi:hypothetical protein